MRKYLLILLVVLIFLFSLGCSSQHEDNVIKVGYLPIVPDLSFFVALDKGFFSNNDLIVEPVRFSTSVTAIEAVYANRIEATSLVGLSNIFAAEINVPNQVKIFEMVYAGENTSVHRILVGKDSKINNLYGLKGKKIGTYPGSQMKVFTKLVLHDFLDTENDITIISIKSANQVEALASASVDALFTIEPEGTMAEELGVGKVIYTNPLYEIVLKPFPTAASILSQKFIDEKPELAELYIKSIYQAIDYLHRNPYECRKYLTKYTNIETKIALKTGIYKYWKVNEIDMIAVNKLNQLYYKYKVIEKLIKPKQLLYHYIQ